jgi:hypothetical protein
MPGEAKFDMAFGFTNGISPSVGSLQVHYNTQSRDKEGKILIDKTIIETKECGDKISSWV